MPTSSVQQSRDALARGRGAPEEVTLQVWPLRQQPLRSLAALAVATGISCWIAVAYDRFWLGFLAGGLLLVTLWRMWLPVTYEVGAAGVSQCIFGRRRRIAWAAIGSYQVRGEGVLLVPDIQIAPLSPLRGTYVPWHNQRDKMLANVEYYLQSRGA